MEVIGRFLKIAEELGDRPAVVTSAGSTSYRELETAARRFASLFSTKRGSRVVIAFEQGATAYAAMLGTMMAGGYYVPISMTAPEEKLRTICKAFDPDFIAGEVGVAASLQSTCPAAIICQEDDLDSTESFEGPMLVNDVAYVIFTSGSTGQPKGVVIPHAALEHYIDWVCGSGLLGRDDRVSQYSNIAFDLSVIEIFGALTCGATLVPFTSRSQRLLPAETVCAFNITVWISVPSVISLMKKANQLTRMNMHSICRFFFCGEPLLEEHVAGILGACPRAEIWNSYGPTETTVSMTCVKVTEKKNRDAVQTSVALGDAIPGMELRLLGGDDASSGEIVIIGPQLAIGYWRAAEQTASAFREIVVDGTIRRAYFTGDWARKSGHHVFFDSRIDHQVKINGFRIELNEVAAAIRSLGWSQVVVVKARNQLVAVMEDSGGTSSVNRDEIHQRLAKKLDRYALPSHFVVLDHFPRNQNDKIDLRAITSLATAAVS